MDNPLRSSVKSPLAAPICLLVVCILAYGLLIPSLGYYWDDLPYALVYHRIGPGGYPAFVAADRPFSAWVFMGLTWLLGEQPLGYHIFGLLLYWLCAVFFWRLILLLWPHYEKEALWAALLFAVYPGFLGQPKTIIYNHHFSAMALYLFSLIASVQAVHMANSKGGWIKSWRWHLPSVLAMVLSQFTIEYYLGWEAVRIAAIWLALTQHIPNKKQRLRHSFLHQAPYALATLGFLIWRVFIFQFPTYQPINDSSIEITNISWWQNLLNQVVDAVFVVWRRAVPLISRQEYSRPFWWSYLTLILFSMGFIFLFLRIKFHDPHKFDQDEDTQSHQTFAGSALMVALLGIGFAGWPFWLVDLQLSIEGHFRSRFTLAFIPWAALLTAALIHLLSRIRLRPMQIITSGMVALLVGGSIGWHFWNANFYRNQWIDVQRFFQQLVHRAPGLEKGTILLINDMQAIELYQDDSLTALLNWTYAPENKTPILDYAMFYLSVRLGTDLPVLEPGLPIEKDYRSFHFSGSTDRILVVHFEPPGCLRVVDGNQPDRIPLTLPEAMLSVLPLSNLNVIQTDPTLEGTPKIPFFDLGETQSWCLFFQEAELAAQRGEWAQVAKIGDQAYAGEDRPNEITENFVFIEGYLRDGNLSRAFQVSKSLNEDTQGQFNGRICNLWQAVEQDIPNGFNQMRIYQNMMDNFCSIE